MSEGDTTIHVEAKEETKPSRVAKLRRWIGGKIAGEDATERIEDTWGRIHSVGGFLPIFVEGRLEYRTSKQREIFNEIQTSFEKCETPEEFQKKMYKANLKVFTLFHTTGTQWLRGLSDSFTAKKIRAFLELFQRVGDNPSFTKDVFTCAMQMINISWKPEDVQRLPPYLIETKTVIQPSERTGVDLGSIKRETH